MCGIIGYAGQQEASPILLEGLRALQYRGYDSAGVAVLNKGTLSSRKGVGAVETVNKEHHIGCLPGTLGIGHVRWATHGGVCDSNAHPHLDCKSEIAVVHNGILDNYQTLRKQLSVRHEFTSETDTEVVSHLMEDCIANGDSLLDALQHTVSQIEGSYALAILSSLEPDKIIATKKESPLVVGSGPKGFFVASDIVSLLGLVDSFFPLEDGEIAIIRACGIRIYDRDGREIQKQLERVKSDWLTPSKNGFKHYMLKEILEQPDTIEICLQQDNRMLLEIALEILRARQVVITACGTSRHAALLGRYLFSKMGGKFCEVVMASEFEYFANSIDKNTVVIAISQSGETADVISGVKMAKASGARVLSIVNVPGSTLTRMSDRVIYMNCGPEIAVAATKSFVAELVTFYLLAFAMLNQLERGKGLLRELAGHIREDLSTNGDDVRALGKFIVDKQDFYFLARGINYAIALEGALKLKEVSYIHAEGMPAAELKHGTLALIEKGTPVLAICPNDYTHNDTLSNAMETKARGAFVIGLSDKNNEIFDMWIKIPPVDEIFYPLVSVIPLQVLAYYAATNRGKDPDRPRNLAKSVTVK